MVSGIACVGVKGMIFDVCICPILAFLFYHFIIRRILHAYTHHFTFLVSNGVASSFALPLFSVIDFIFAPSWNRLVISNVS